MKTAFFPSRKNVLSFWVRVIFLSGGSLFPVVAASFPASFPGKWETIGRAELKTGADSITIANGLAITGQSRRDYEFSFRARMPESAEQVQIWSAVRVRDRGSLYAIGYRGGAEPQLSLARYAPDGKSRFLGWVPLDPPPKAGEWVDFRVLVSGKRFQIYLNREDLPRINIEDKEALWEEGGVGLGGGWLPAEFASPKIEELDGAKLEAFSRVGDRVWTTPQPDKKAVRVQQRSAYQPAILDAVPEERKEMSLNGNWLFMPDQELAPGLGADKITAEAGDDQDWHVLPVPGFWTPTVGWLHGEVGMPGLKDAAASKGPSDKLMGEEFDRVNAQTFDWKKTKSGWYRHHLDLPSDLKGKSYELVFDAIAKVSEVWVNGQRVAANVGMFRQIRCDISKVLKPGHNVVAVHVIGNPDRQVQDAKKVADIAVTVEVTFEMLNSLPHGMTDNNSGGIWQPVRLVVANPVQIGDIHILPALDGFKATVELENRGANPVQVVLGSQIIEAKGTAVLFSAPPQTAAVPPGGRTEVEIRAAGLAPKQWSPANPNLYAIKLDLSIQGSVVDHKSEKFGFRTFTVEGNKLMLNGKPFWLRGGNHFPVTLRPNDAELARKFTQLAKDGNVNITRSHGVPFTESWFEAADEIGMGVSFEGTWPWLMLNGPTPDPDLVKVWHEEFADLIKRNRNHPSLLFWTINNEMQFYKRETLGPEVLKEKWTVLDAMIRDIRRLDPTRPIVPDSAYTRKEAEKKFPGFRESGKFDDGDIDDTHSYFGWYNESSFNLFDGRFGNNSSTAGRPLISQELSTGYPRNDDWPSRPYQFQRYVPQALVGNDAFEGRDPKIFMTRQAFMTKEVAEAIRRTNRDNANGALHFAYLTWFTDVWKAESIRPKLTYYELKTALQPVLVSAELYGRHYYSGTLLKHRICLANDAVDTADLPAGTLEWKITDRDTILAEGAVNTPPVRYYSNEWLNLDLPLPSNLPRPRVDAVLSYELKAGGKTVSENHYDIVLASDSWANDAAKNFVGQLYDPQGKSRALTTGLNLAKIENLERLDKAKVWLVGDLAALLKEANGESRFKAFIEEGGRALILNGGDDLPRLLPEKIRSFRKAPGEIVSMEVPESPVFDGIEALDLAWFNTGERKVPVASGGTYEVDRTQEGIVVLAHECRLHSDIKAEEFFKNAGCPLVEISLGRGKIMASEILFSSKDSDPVAGRLMGNILKYLNGK